MVIGLTGKSCSGKNVVGQILSDAGYLVWDTDAMCHDGLILNKEAVISVFGEETGLDRKKIGKVVFSDPSKRKALEDILYPWLRRQVTDWKASNPRGVLFLNGALLYRAGFADLCDCVVYVDAPYEVRLRRAMERDGVSEEVFALREKSQQDVDFRTVDYGIPVHVVSNCDGDFDNLNRQVFNICDKIGIFQGNRN